MEYDFSAGWSGSAADIQRAADQLERQGTGLGAPDEIEATLRGFIASGGPSIVYQPIVHLGSQRVIGVEALSRFAGDVNPAECFALADRFGLRSALEMSAAKRAIAELDRETRRQLGWEFVGINFSPSVVTDPAFERDLGPLLGRHVVLEIEAGPATMPSSALRAELDRARAVGARIAVNTLGCGPDDLVRYRKTEPDIVKLDRSVTVELTASPERRQVAASILQLWEQHGAFVIGTRVESLAELDLLAEIGVEAAQGHVLGRPQPLSAVVGNATG